MLTIDFLFAVAIVGCRNKLPLASSSVVGEKRAKNGMQIFASRSCELRIYFNQTRGDRENAKRECSGEFCSVHAKFVSMS